MRRLGIQFIGVLSALVYAFIALYYGWNGGGKTHESDAVAWITVLLLVWLYWEGYRSLQQTPCQSLRHVVLPAIPLVVLSFCTVPYDSTDVFSYMNTGWMQSHYGLNPYAHTLRDIPDVGKDPMIRSEWMQQNKNPWLDLPFVYGFLFAFVARSLASIGGGNWWLTLGLFKLLSVAAYTVCARLIWQLSKANGNLRRDLTVYLFCWSPLILQHHIANAHNDLLVGSLMVIATWLLTNARLRFWAPAAIMASAMIKYVTLPLVPLSIWFIAKRKGWKAAAVSTSAALLVAGISALPYAGNIAEFHSAGIVSQMNKVTAGSLYACVFYLYRFVAQFVPAVIPIETFGLLLKILLWSIGAILIAASGYRFCRKTQPGYDDWIVTISWVLFVIIFIASSQFYSWYIGMMFPAVLLLRPGHRLRSLVILLSGTHAFSLTSLSRKGIGYFLLTIIPLLRA